MSQATAEDVVRSSRLMDDEHLSRSLLDTGIVDERQTQVWPELCESAHTSPFSTISKLYFVENDGEV